MHVSRRREPSCFFFGISDGVAQNVMVATKHDEVQRRDCWAGRASCENESISGVVETRINLTSNRIDEKHQEREEEVLLVLRGVAVDAEAVCKGERRASVVRN